MSAKYTIQAIPTVYRGRRYRSRLEARWAAFFDLLGWRAEYEPYDLGTWSPDFLLNEEGINVLVEVKPQDDLSMETWDKCIAACDRAGLLDPEIDHGIQAVFLTRLAPVRDEDGLIDIGWFSNHACPQAGWLPQSAKLVWRSSFANPDLRPDIAHVEERGFFTAFGDAGPAYDDFRRTVVHRAPHSYPTHSLDLWAKATNVVQWKVGVRT